MQLVLFFRKHTAFREEAAETNVVVLLIYLLVNPQRSKCQCVRLV